MEFLHKPTPIEPARGLVLAVATGLGTGYLPIPGTWGTLLVFLFHRLLWPRAFTPEHWFSGLIVLGIAAAVAIVTAGIAERHYGNKDDRRINVDEMAGYLVSVYWLPAGWQPAIAAFFLFRLMDIVKPLPARRIQDLHGGFGIVLDDIFAGLYTCLILNAAFRLL